jgi:hypothetical protein
MATILASQTQAVNALQTHAVNALKRRQSPASLPLLTPLHNRDSMIKYHPVQQHRHVHTTRPYHFRTASDLPPNFCVFLLGCFHFSVPQILVWDEGVHKARNHSICTADTDMCAWRLWAKNNSVGRFTWNCACSSSRRRGGNV